MKSKFHALAAGAIAATLLHSTASYGYLIEASVASYGTYFGANCIDARYSFAAPGVTAGCANVPDLGASVASAEIAGTLKTFARGAVIGGDPFTNPFSMADASLTEILHFNSLSGGNITGDVPAALIAHLSGVLTPNLDFEQRTGSSSAAVGLRLTVDLPYTAQVWYVISTSPLACIDGVRCIQVPAGLPFTLHLPLEFLLAPTFRFTVSLGARAYNLGEVNLMNTALLDLALPAGYTFTSESELFLPNWTPTIDEPNPVPEPTSLALLGLGLAGLVAARRRKH